jgi:alanine dehydrogenase
MMMGEIFDERTGFTSIMAFRTGATTGVGVDALARKDAKVFGLFGSGGQAVNKILAINAIRDIEKVKVYSRNLENRVAFCDKMAPMINKEVVPVQTPEEVIKDSDVVISATDSNVPVFDGSLLEPGQHVVTVVGSNSALVEGGWLKSGRRENDDETVRRADVIAVNHLESVTMEKQAGLYDPIQQGIITEDDIHSLGSILTGTHPGRTSDEQITYHFNNNGTAAADMALAKIVFDRAKEQGRGNEMDIPIPGTQ